MAAYSLADTWRLNNRVNQKLLGALIAEQLSYQPAPRARTIAGQFAHIHNTRLMWIQATTANKLSKLEPGTASQAEIAAALDSSAEALAQILVEAGKTGKLTTFKRGPTAFLGYLLSHEAHHRGQVILHLKKANLPLSKESTYALWDWDKL